MVEGDAVNPSVLLLYTAAGYMGVHGEPGIVLSLVGELEPLITDGNEIDLPGVPPLPYGGVLVLGEAVFFDEFSSNL